jgi:Fic family protein
MVPSLDWFIYAFVRKEAVLSSQIEGTQATLVDLLTFEAQGTEEPSTPPNADIEEVCNYLEALTYSRTQIADPKGLPLSMRLLSETHQRLMRGVRGAEKLPGEVRRSQNWIGGSRPGNAAYVPPPPHALAEVLSAFEKYLHADDTLPPLVRAGLLHVQFETIHPYLGGNGRIGRLLVTLLLEHWKLVTKPLLYLSLYFKRHREDYYRRLTAVRVDGDWEGWLDFFLDGVATIADEAVGVGAGAVRARRRGPRACARARRDVGRSAAPLRAPAEAPGAHRCLRDEARGDDQADRRPRDRVARRGWRARRDDGQEA